MPPSRLCVISPSSIYLTYSIVRCVDPRSWRSTRRRLFIDTFLRQKWGERGEREGMWRIIVYIFFHQRGHQHLRHNAFTRCAATAARACMHGSAAPNQHSYQNFFPLLLYRGASSRWTERAQIRGGHVMIIMVNCIWKVFYMI